ncbi:serine hydrolase domain-containing protein [Geobacter sp.]|uniref:serine hydrolase domain-containing protein n=1 Tax=Geobacter sp. TaxID=46610 RepID=UPI00261B0E0F|nr:serine hydrolase domain-containing protein [Geobacter sp.]
MRHGKLLVILCVLLSSLTVFAGDVPLVVTSEKAGIIGAVVEKAMADGLVAGGVVLVGNRTGVVCETAFGRTAGTPDAPPVTSDTLFDLASLTKVIATTPAVMKLAEEGKVSLVDPVVRWFPEFAGKGKDEVLVVNLLTHTSGLDDFPPSPRAPLQSAIEGAAAQKLKGEPGHRFRYADINFILLAELVRRASGAPLDRYASASFYAPLGMWDTCFNPGPAAAGRCAATLDGSGLPQFGKVQDPAARLLDGVAGHAGLFSTVGDLASFCRMILNGGTLNGHQVLEPRTVAQMTAPYFSRSGKVARGLGWDISSPYSSPRGNGFSEYSFGHTGYSGGSVWLDPDSGSYVIFLSSRLDYRHTRAFSKLRSDISTLAFEMLEPTFYARAVEGGGTPSRFR